MPRIDVHTPPIDRVVTPASAGTVNATGVVDATVASNLADAANPPLPPTSATPAVPRPIPTTGDQAKVLFNAKTGWNCFEQCPAVKAGAALTIDYQRSPADFSKKPDVSNVIKRIALDFRIDRGDWQHAVIADGSVDLRSGALLRQPARIDVPATAKGEVEYHFTLTLGDGSIAADDDLGRNYHTSIEPQTPPPSMLPAQARLDGDSVVTLVERGFPGTDAPVEVRIPKRFFNLDDSGQPIVFSDAGGRPVDSLEHVSAVFIRGPHVDVRVENLQPHVPLEESICAGMTCFAVANEVKELAQQALGHELPWYNGARLELFPQASTVRAVDLLNAGAGIDSEDVDHDGAHEGVVLFDVLSYAAVGTNIPGVGGMRPGMVSRDPEVVAHETGHQIFNAMLYQRYGDHTARPDKPLFNAPVLLGIHETVGDVTAVLHQLKQPEVQELVRGQAGADLHKNNMVARHGELRDYMVALMQSDVPDKVRAAYQTEYTLQAVLSGAQQAGFLDQLSTLVAGQVNGCPAVPAAERAGLQQAVKAAAPPALLAAVDVVGGTLAQPGDGLTSVQRLIDELSKQPEPTRCPLFEQLAAVFRGELLARLDQSSPVLGALGRDQLFPHNDSTRWIFAENLRRALTTAEWTVKRPADYEQQLALRTQQAVARWTREHYDAINAPADVARTFNKQHHLDELGNEPHNVSQAMTSAFYQVLADLVLEQTRSGTDFAAAMGPACDRVGKIFFRALEALPDISEVSWPALAQAISETAQQLDPALLTSWQQAMADRRIYAAPAQVTPGHSISIMHNPVAVLGVREPVKQVELQYRFGGGPVQYAAMRDGAFDVAVPADAAGEMEYWFKVVKQDNQELWDSRFGNNYRVKVSGDPR